MKYEPLDHPEEQGIDGGTNTPTHRQRLPTHALDDEEEVDIFSINSTGGNAATPPQPNTAAGDDAHQEGGQESTEIRSDSSRARSVWHQTPFRATILLVVTILSACLIAAYLRKYQGGVGLSEEGQGLMTRSANDLITRIAFGSCTSYDLDSSQPIWVEGMIPASPHAWIWAGDMAYLDDPDVNCGLNPEADTCQCEGDWLHIPPWSCLAGDLDHAKKRWHHQLMNKDYLQFMEYMCPGTGAADAAAVTAIENYVPPYGADRELCPRPYIGIYDDHDSNWNDGNMRLPLKEDFKNLFLDAMGEPATSERREKGRGAQAKYVFNEGTGREIEVYLLDLRYYRETLPCHIRRQWCEEYVLTLESDPKKGWCQDFLYGGDSGQGTCCKKDEEIYWGWCLLETSKTHALYSVLCDDKDPQFGSVAMTLDPVTGDPQEDVGGNGGSSFCEVLGVDQRQWLRDTLLQSTAALKIVVSPSVLITNPVPSHCPGTTNLTCHCGGDDWGCYQVAQRNFLNSILSHVPGCLVIMTGDYHFADIKVLRPGPSQPYAEAYDSASNAVPIYQVMASGLTNSTARDFPCADYRKDPLGLRDHGECDFTTGPNFGLIDVRYAEHGPHGGKANEQITSIGLQIRDGNNKVMLQSVITADMCQPRLPVGQAAAGR